MPAPYRHIDLPDRRVIFRMINEQRPIEEIAERTGFHRSTIYPEIGRSKSNRIARTDRFVTINITVPKAISRQVPISVRWLVNTPDLLRHVTDKLKDTWSPQQIAGRLAIDDHAPGRISHETIYQYAYSDDARSWAEPIAAEARKRRRPRFGRKPRQAPMPAERAAQMPWPQDTARDVHEAVRKDRQCEVVLTSKVVPQMESARKAKVSPLNKAEMSLSLSGETDRERGHCMGGDERNF